LVPGDLILLEAGNRFPLMFVYWNASSKSRWINTPANHIRWKNSTTVT
jgi:hypothetical protein